MSQLSIINHQKAAFDARFYTVEQLRSFHHKASWGVKCAAIASWFLSAFFIGQFFAGAEFEYMASWRLVQYVYATMGIILATALTFAEVVLFNSGKVREYLAVAALSVSLGVFMETAATMQREQSAVKFKSEQSPVFKATLNAAQQLTRPALSDAQIRLANAQALLNGAANQNEREVIQHRINRLENQVNLEQANNSALLSQTLKTAKSLEYDESNHQAMIRFLAESLGWSYVKSSAFLAFFLIITFKACFHYLGTIRSRTERAIEIKQGNISEVLEWAEIQHPALPNTRVPVRELPHGEKGAAALPTRHNTEALHGRDTAETPPQTDKALLDLIQERYQIAIDKRAGESTECPTCGTVFKKRTHNHYFCKTGCKDQYWNLIRPERLVAARGG